MTDQTETTDNTGREQPAKVKTSRHNVTNPTRADHVINATNKHGHARRVVIPAGKVVENVEIADHEVESMRETQKKMGEGNFISFSPSSGGEDAGMESKLIPKEELTRDTRPGDEPSKDKDFDPVRNPLPTQDPRNLREAGKPAQPPQKK